MQAIRESEGLAVLRLSGNSMGVKAAHAIAGALASRPSLRRALWSDMFVSRLKSEIPPALVHHNMCCVYTSACTTSVHHNMCCVYTSACTISVWS